MRVPSSATVFKGTWKKETCLAGIGGYTHRALVPIQTFIIAGPLNVLLLCFLRTKPPRCLSAQAAGGHAERQNREKNQQKPHFVFYDDWTVFFVS
jgi:hypothetical protein